VSFILVFFLNQMIKINLLTKKTLIIEELFKS